MSPVFDAYARYYDLLYRDKDYASEATYVASHLRRQGRAEGVRHILELGCGTGAHAEQLARQGYCVHGVDRSETMLARAKARKAGLPSEIGDKLTFETGDVRSVRVSGRFEAAISLFHVMSYQTTDADLEAVVGTAAEHLSPGGLFIFDYWYGPAVLSQKPVPRIRELEDADIKVTRTAHPVMREELNVVDVNYAVRINEKASGKVLQLHETHSMRYLFLPEVSRMFDPRQWRETRTFGWLKHEEPGQEDWAACTMAIRG